MGNPNTNFGHQDGVDIRDLMSAQFSNIRTLIEANDKNYNQRFENVIQATKSALDAADRAVNKAETAAEKRFEGLNELRNVVTDQQKTFPTKIEVDLQFMSVNEKINTLNTLIVNHQSRGAGINQGINWAMIFIGAVGLITGIILGFTK